LLYPLLGGGAEMLGQKGGGSYQYCAKLDIFVNRIALKLFQEAMEQQASGLLD